MRNILLTGTLALLLAASCQESKQATPTGKCHISGTIPQQYNDKRIFLVPLKGPQTAQYVDSIEVKNGHFEFEKDTLMMAKIVMDYHYRMNLQPLLVVVEPGEVKVVIDSVSSASGTPQNDSLEKWKQATEAYHRQAWPLRRYGQKAQADSLYLAYKRYSRRLAADLKAGLLHDFLTESFPTTYKKQLPDGRIVTMDSDTNEEIGN